MAGGLLKSLQCKSRALEDVVNPYPRHILSSSSCRRTAQTIKDVVVVDHKVPSHHNSSKKKPIPKPTTGNHSATATSTTPSPATASFQRRSSSARNPDQTPRSLTELPMGHPSRNVVEIIFHTSWGYNCKPFSGLVELVFKVQNGPRTVARFEEYRRSVKDRASVRAGGGGGTAEEDARCIADGNEMMRFHCLGPTGEYGGGTWAFPEGKGGGAAICTFSGSGRAHEMAPGGGGGAGRGRRAMLVCRVMAGRVSNRVGLEPVLLDGKAGFDSVWGDSGELVVFDPRAVLPCFLVIYKL